MVSLNSRALLKCAAQVVLVTLLVSQVFADKEPHEESSEDDSVSIAVFLFWHSKMIKKLLCR